jgi:hypothetical protein
MSNGVTNGKLRKFFTLSATDKQDLLLAAFWLPLMHCRLKRFGLNACLVLLETENRGRVRQEAHTAEDYEQGCGCERSVAVAARYGLVAGTCLSCSLTVMRLLGRRGIAGQLRIGVNLESGALEAHAWVEVAGVPLGRAEQRFQPFQPLLSL